MRACWAVVIPPFCCAPGREARRRALQSAVNPRRACPAPLAGPRPTSRRWSRESPETVGQGSGVRAGFGRGDGRRCGGLAGPSKSRLKKRADSSRRCEMVGRLKAAFEAARCWRSTPMRPVEQQSQDQPTAVAGTSAGGSQRRHFLTAGRTGVGFRKLRARRSSARATASRGQPRAGKKSPVAHREQSLFRKATRCSRRTLTNSGLHPAWR